MIYKLLCGCIRELRTLSVEGGNREGEEDERVGKGREEGQSDGERGEEERTGNRGEVGRETGEEGRAIKRKKENRGEVGGRGRKRKGRARNEVKDGEREREREQGKEAARETDRENAAPDTKEILTNTLE